MHRTKKILYSTTLLYEWRQPSLICLLCVRGILERYPVGMWQCMHQILSSTPRAINEITVNHVFGCNHQKRIRCAMRIPPAAASDNL